MSGRSGKRFGLITLAAMVAFGTTACDDDDNGTGPRPPDLSREDVAGQYVMTTLTFDPRGSLPETDILARIADLDIPDLIVSSDDDALQLVFQEPGGFVHTVDGTYQLGDTGIQVDFESNVETSMLLLPADFALNFSEADGSLSFAEEIQADTTRLFELVPEWSGEPVTNPLPGDLQVVFSRVEPLLLSGAEFRP